MRVGHLQLSLCARQLYECEGYRARERDRARLLGKVPEWSSDGYLRTNKPKHNDFTLYVYRHVHTHTHTHSHTQEEEEDEEGPVEEVEEEEEEREAHAALRLSQACVSAGA